MMNMRPWRPIAAFGPQGPRQLHLVDVENLVGSGRPTVQEVKAAHAALTSVVPIGADDHVVIGAGPASAIPAHLGRPGARIVVRPGPDGADRALLDVIESEDPASRFGRITIASGDGIFADPVAALISRGVDVTVVARRGSVSRRLRMAAREILYLPTTPIALPHPQDAA